MLILTRKEGQSLKIGEDIEITLSSSSKGVAKLAIKAPKSLMILRSELINQIKDENLHATTSKDSNLNELSKKLKKN